MSAPGASTFPVPSYFGQRPLATAASSPTSPTHLQHAVRYSSKTLVLDHMLYLQLNARVRQLRRSSSARLASLSGSQLTDGPSSTSAADEPSEVDRLGYGRRCRSTDGGRSRTAHVQTSSQAPVAHRMPSPIVEEEDESAELEAKAAGYERMLSVLLERVRLSSSGLSTPAPESTASSDEEDDDDDDDYIVSPPEEEAEDEVLPEGVRLRLGLAGLVDVLARPSNDLERLSTDVEQRPEVAAEILAGSVPEPSSAQRQAFARLQPLIPPLSASSRLSRKLRAICLPAAAQARAWFDAGVTGSKHVDSANVSDGSRASRSSTPAPATLSSIGSRQTSASGTFSTSGLGPAPDRWYDLARPSATITSAWSSSHSPSLGGTSTASDSFGRPDDDSGEPGRWVELLERFLLVSADLAIAVGRSTIDEEERRRRARSSARGGVLRPLVARGGHGFTPAFGPRAGAGIGAAAGSWAARLGRTPSTAAFLVPAVVWESDSEESVDEAEAERRAAGDVGLDDSTSDNDDERLAEDSDDPMLEPVDDGRASAPQRLPPRRTRRISNPPSRSRSSSAGSNDSPPRETRASSTTSTAGVDFSVDRSAAARPTRAWFALLAALVRQVILSGFLDAAWRGLSSVEAMLAIGCVSIAATDAAFGDGVSAGRNGSSSSSGRSSSPPEAVVGGIERAGWVLFGCSSAGDTGESKRRREFRRANRLTFRELTEFSTETPSLEAHLLALLEVHPPEEVDQAVLGYIAAAAEFLGTPELARQATPAASAELRNASNGPRRLPISSLLNPTPSAPRSFPTYQQEPPTPPSDPSRAPRRRGLGRWLVAPRPRRDGPAVAGVKRGRDGGEASATKSGRRRSVCSDSTPASGNASGVGRPLMPTIVVEDWPDPYGVESTI